MLSHTMLNRRNRKGGKTMKKMKNDSTPFYLEYICKKYSKPSLDLKINVHEHFPEDSSLITTFIAINEETKQNLPKCSMNQSSN